MTVRKLLMAPADTLGPGPVVLWLLFDLGQVARADLAGRKIVAAAVPLDDGDRLWLLAKSLLRVAAVADRECELALSDYSDWLCYAPAGWRKVLGGFGWRKLTAPARAGQRV